MAAAMSCVEPEGASLKQETQEAPKWDENTPKGDEDAAKGDESAPKGDKNTPNWDENSQCCCSTQELP